MKLNKQRESTSRFFRVFCALPEREINASVSVTFSGTIDLTAIEFRRAEAERAGQVKPSYTAFVVSAVASALREHRYANRRVFRAPWRIGGPWLYSFKQIDIAVAVEIDVPEREYVAFVDILRNADQLSLHDISSLLKTLAQSTELSNQQLRQLNLVIRYLPWRIAALILRLPAWLPSLWARYRGASVLVSSPAKYGVESVNASWAWPIGISFGYVSLKPMVFDGEIKSRPCFQFSMNFDRRTMAGGPAARFFKEICQRLEQQR